MNEKSIRIRIPEFIFKKYKIICAQKDLSIPKQTSAIIKEFIQIHEENEKRFNKP